MAQDTLLGFPAHTLPYRCGGFTTLSTVSKGHDKCHALLLNIETIFRIYAVLPDTQCRGPSGTFAIPDCFQNKAAHDCNGNGNSEGNRL